MLFIRFMFFSDEGPTLETLQFAFYIPAIHNNFLYFDFYTTYAAH